MHRFRIGLHSQADSVHEARLYEGSPNSVYENNILIYMIINQFYATSPEPGRPRNPETARFAGA